jgi:hypothetical protein
MNSTNESLAGLYQLVATITINYGVVETIPFNVTVVVST